MTSAMTSDAQIPVPPGGAWAVGDAAGIRLRGTHGFPDPTPAPGPAPDPATASAAGSGPDPGSARPPGPALNQGSGPGQGFGPGRGSGLGQGFGPDRGSGSDLGFGLGQGSGSDRGSGLGQDPGSDPDLGSGSGSGSGPGSGGRVEVGGLAAVLAVWPVLGTLVEEGALRLHTPLAAYAPTLGRATAHQLLTRTGDHTLLARLAEHVTGRPLAELAAERIWQPLAMTRTAFAPALHTALEDTAAFLRHLLAPGAGPLTADWIADSLRIRTGELAPSRGLLWRPAPGTDRRQDIWVHHATPGPTALWISPRHHRWAILLTPPAPHAPPHTGLRDAFRAFAFGPSE
ncbi:hypothetical protein DEJ50_02070 [Streptomyces venezuelae]|uniref:Beta-lactamase-related domain-containing protein n=1 Tax=Streptomyces venezuelae TaxID=54571 RepID=A0A5P2CV88_STRVZ|nr:serine hydrolase [Streptomyces venezuelae]QES46822.1 hypothetical protein DEJ50_02070 [Streptomyces venezuelae]